ncbi:MAG: hypothetical protein ACTSP9_15240 [Promethearchaeota archaeon]
MDLVDIITVIIGIILALITTICFNLAFVYQKKGLNQATLKGVEIKFEGGIKGILKTFWWLFKNKSWAFGFFLGVAGWFPYVISIGMIGIIVTEPVMATGFIVFVIAAIVILKERVGALEYTAIALLTISPILIAFTGISNVDIDLHGFVPSFIIFLLIVIPISIISLVFAKKKKGTSVEGLLTMFGGAILFALGGVATNILAQALIQTGEGFQWYTLLELPFGIFWFIFGGNYAHLWVFLGFWLMTIFNISSVPFYQGGFQSGKLLIMYPILDTVALLLPITAGILVFRQTFTNYLLFFIALVFIVFATLILAKYQLAIETIEPEGSLKQEEEEIK